MPNNVPVRNDARASVRSSTTAATSDMAADKPSATGDAKRSERQTFTLRTFGLSLHENCREQHAECEDEPNEADGVHRM